MFFLFLFLQRLPRELRVLLDEDDTLTPRQLADKLWVKHSHQHGTVAAAVAEEDHPVAAVQSGRSSGGAPRRCGQQVQRSRGGPTPRFRRRRRSDS
jgi:hypothetical protein